MAAMPPDALPSTAHDGDATGAGAGGEGTEAAVPMGMYADHPMWVADEDTTACADCGALWSVRPSADPHTTLPCYQRRCCCCLELRHQSSPSPLDAAQRAQRKLHFTPPVITACAPCGVLMRAVLCRSMLVWRHHCRYCGGVYCGECADQEFLLMPPRGSSSDLAVRTIHASIMHARTRDCEACSSVAHTHT
jgi:hypothetical protein